VAVALPTMKQIELAADVAQTYEHQTGANVGNFVQAKAVAVSPDCGKLLISAGITYLNARSSEEAAKESIRFPKQWYVVNLASGKISFDARSVERPKEWY
jgi:hypothetical protein